MMEDTDQGFFWFTDHCCPHHFFNLEFCFTLNVKTSLQTYTKMSFNCVHRQEEDASKCTSRLCMLFHFWFFPSPRPQTGVSDSSSSRRSGYAEARAVMVDRTPYTSPSSLDEEDLSLIRSHSFIRQTWHVVILLHPHAHGQMEPDHHLPLLPFHRHQKRKKTIFSSLQAFDVIFEFTTQIHVTDSVHRGQNTCASHARHQSAAINARCYIMFEQRKDCSTHSSSTQKYLFPISSTGYKIED